MTIVHFSIAIMLFVVSLSVMMWYNYQLIRSADRRLRMANEMVLKLASSADTLAQSVSEMKSMMVHLESVYTARNNVLSQHHDELLDSYKKLLARYEELQVKHDNLQQKQLQKYEQITDDMTRTVQEMARKPTIHNN